ncbi:GIN domain-containing protein [Comamonas thiooxydans]|uniref:GIN domain-containing protein n=1 Tax=Comamonas thiooxydans TaxID=363952 RepID=UPI000B40CF25|nr:DUF2807 domain-containing protein [Comamonas thiooxydans]
MRNLSIIWALLTGRLSADNVTIHGRDGLTCFGSIYASLSRGRFETLTCGHRDVGNFTGIALSAPVYVSWAPADKPCVSVVAPERIQPRIKTVVDRDGVLRVDATGSWPIRDEIEVILTGPQLNRVWVSGSGTLTVVGVKGEAMEAVVSGSGDLQMSGDVATFHAVVSGQGDVLAPNLKADHVQATVSGSGDLELYAGRSIQGQVSGSGDLDVHGQPASKQVTVSGNGDVRYL